MKNRPLFVITDKQITMNLKKTVCLLLFSTAVFGTAAQRFEGGVLVGFNGTQVEGDTYKGYNKPGLLAGAYIQTDLAPAVFAGMEIKYSQKGARNRQDPKNPNPEKYIMRLNYVDIPFFAGFRTSETISVIGGASLGYLIRATEYNEYGEFPPQDQKSFNDFDLQPFVGFQFELLDRLKLDLRMAYSVLPVRGKPENDLWYWRQNQFNNVISLALYYRLDR